MNRFWSILLKGLATVLPIFITVYSIYWLGISSEEFLGGAIKYFVSDEYYWPGMGVVVGLAAVFSVGLLMHAYVVQRMFAKGEKLLYHTPVVRSIYQALRDFLNYFSPDSRKEFEQVVAVTLGDSGMQVIGFVTQADPASLPEDFRQQDSILVYLPLSYMIGGYAVLVPRSAVRPVDMNMEEAMRFTLTAGVTGTARPRTGA